MQRHYLKALMDFKHLDDILIRGETKEQHGLWFRQVLDRAPTNNFKLSKGKNTCVILSKEGLKPDLAKVKEIQRMPVPGCNKNLFQFLWMVTFLAKFIPIILNTQQYCLALGSGTAAAF